MSWLITVEDLWTGLFDDRSEISRIVDPADHIHGRFKFIVDDRPLPSLGYFGPDDVCLNEWLRELWMAIARLSGSPVAGYQYDEGEQGQPCFRFEREHHRVYLSVIEGAGGGLSNPEWQRIEMQFGEFVGQVAGLTNAIRARVTPAAKDVGTLWLNRHVDLALEDAYHRRDLVAMDVLLSAGMRPDAVDWIGDEQAVTQHAVSDGEHAIWRSPGLTDT